MQTREPPYLVVDNKSSLVAHVRLCGCSTRTSSSANGSVFSFTHLLSIVHIKISSGLILCCSFYPHSFCLPLMYTMILNHPLVEIISTTSQVCIVEDNAKSHAVHSVPQPHAPRPPCRWQSSPVLPVKPKFPSLKRSSSVPPTSVPSLTSLVTPVRRRSLEFGPRERRLKASELLSEYLRLSTQELSLLDLNDNDDDKDEEDFLPESLIPVAPRLSVSSPSLTSNVKKPVRRKSLDGSTTTAC